MKLPKNTELKKCIVCEKEFIKTKQGKRAKQNKSAIRGPKTKTCSKKCSKVYTRIKQDIRSKMRNKNESKVF